MRLRKTHQRKAIMFSNYIHTLKCYWKIIKCRYAGKHSVEVIEMGGWKYKGCRKCDLWRCIEH